MTDILTEQNFTCNDNASVINDLQGRIQEFLMGGGGGVAPDFDSETLRKLCWANNYFSQQNSTQLLPPQSCAVTSLVSVFFAPPPLPWTWILLVKDSPLEHPFLALGYKCCTDIVNINVKVMVEIHECKS